MYTLYHFPYSQHGRRIIALLEENNIPYTLKMVAMDKGEHMSPEFLDINPNHQVPVLMDDDFKVYESNAILRYLCNKHQLKAWYPDEAKSRGLTDQWLDWNQCRLAPAVIDVVLNSVFLGDKGDKAAIERGEKRLQELLPILESGLQRTDYLVSNNPTIADISVASNIFQLSLAGKTVAGNTDKWYRRVMSISGVQKSLPSQ